jgi:hypothetical protein
LGFHVICGSSFTALADSFSDGEVIIQLYKANTSENRKSLVNYANKDKEQKSGIERALTSLGIPFPKHNETWDIKARTIDGKDVDEIIVSSVWTVFQFYSLYCGFCRKSIPLIDGLNIKEKKRCGWYRINDYEYYDYDISTYWV